MVAAAGIGSGLDVNGIVSQLMAAERQPLASLAKQEAAYNQKLSAYGQLRGALSGFQSAVQDLSSSSKFQASSATSSNSAVLTASAASKAAPGSYQIEVTQLAQQHKLASTGFTSPDDVVGSGTLTIQFGTYDSVSNSFTPNADKAAQSITIDPANQTLAGIRDAINAADAGVTATVVNDGSAAGNRLVLTSTDSGAANSLKISVADTDGNGFDSSGLSALAYDPTAASGSGRNLEQKATALDALLDIDGIAVKQSTNTVKDAIDGVTLNLAKNNVGEKLTLSVARDTKTVTAAVESFVKAYNSANGTLKSLTAFNGPGAKNGALLGDATARAIQTQLRGMLNTAVGSGGTLTTLSQIGVNFDSDGALEIDSAKLGTAIESSFDDIAALFAQAGKTTDSLVSYSAGASKTQPGSYAVEVTQLATRGATQGSQIADLIVSAGVNDQLDLTVDGKLISVTLAEGTYGSAAALAAEIQSKVNGAMGAAGNVFVTESAGVLNVISARYGSVSQASVTGGNAMASLFGASPAVSTGIDVAGTINGVTASGNGQTLVGAIGDASEGLTLRVAGGALGPRGSANYSTGYAYQLDQYLDTALGDEGGLKARTDGIDGALKRLDQREQQIEARMVQIEKRYRAQFIALDAMLASMNNTSSFLTQQLANLPGSSQG